MPTSLRVPRLGLLPRLRFFATLLAVIQRLLARRRGPRPASRKQMRLLHALCGKRGTKLRGVCKSRTGLWPDQLTTRAASELIRRIRERPPRRRRAKRSRR